jgi:hypothetical protein
MEQPSDGIGDSADKPMVDTHDKKRNTLSRTTNVDNPGGRLSEKKKSSDPVDRKASIPIPSAHAASSDEMGDLLDVTKCKTTKVKTTQSCSTVVRSPPSVLSFILLNVNSLSLGRSARR